MSTGDRTALSYLAKPFTDQMSRAFRDDPPAKSPDDDEDLEYRMASRTQAVALWTCIIVLTIAFYLWAFVSYVAR